ncbi:MAG: hypothetical protein AB7F86_12290 [Bdellovibrionales bacterium]
MDSTDYRNLLAAFEAEIREGRESTVKSEIEALNFAQVPREFLLPLARVCRRSGLLSEGIRLLARVVRPGKHIESPPSQLELAEYGALLTQNGSVAEAQELLSSVDENQVPLVNLYRGFCHVVSWDYEGAIPHYLKMLEAEADSYTKLIARVNLSASYVSTGRGEEARECIKQTLIEAETVKAVRLQGNLHELRAQVYLQEGSFSKCEADLAQANMIFQKSGSLDRLFVEKWAAILAALRDGDTSKLISFKFKARDLGHWESIRETDLYLLKINFEQNPFDHLYFGTPYAGYRNRILREIDGVPSEAFSLNGARSRYMDLSTGAVVGLSADLRAGGKIHQLLVALTQDLYAPRSIPHLFGLLYAGEYFDPETSVSRVRQVIVRLRRWLLASGLPLSIELIKNGYRVVVDSDFSLIYRGPSVVKSTDEILIAQLAQIFPGRRFSLEEAKQSLNLSSAKAVRLLYSSVKQGQIKKVGGGRGTRYLVAG